MKFNSIQELLDTPIEKCIESFREMGKGELLQLVQALKIQYAQASGMKDALLIVVEKGEAPIEDIGDIKETTTQLYTALQLIEDRHNLANKFYLKALKKEEDKIKNIKVQGK